MREISGDIFPYRNLMETRRLEGKSPEQLASIIKEYLHTIKIQQNTI